MAPQGIAAGKIEIEAREGAAACRLNSADTNKCERVSHLRGAHPILLRMVEAPRRQGLSLSPPAAMVRSTSDLRVWGFDPHESEGGRV